MVRLLDYLDRQSRLSLLALALALVVFVGGLDYLTGSELFFSIFYLIPICLVAWFVGRWPGILISLLSIVSWFLADLLTGHTYSQPTIPYWNVAVRLGFFLIVTAALSALRTARQRQEELSHFVVHDLRSPLSNVMTGLETLKDVAGETMDATEQGLVELCLISCNRMLTLINSLLDLARLESGGLPLHLGEIQVGDLVESSSKQVTVRAAVRRVTLTSHLDAGAPTVLADQEVTTRVLVNLLSNAINFSPAGSVVTVSAAPFDARMVAFRVTDQGPGIPKEWATRVFDKFAQVEGQGVSRTVGSGLGLTFCRLAVKAQGGRIWVESGPDQGTTVAFTIRKGEAVAQAGGLEGGAQT
jgi:signal transduction histidine kinase